MKIIFTLVACFTVSLIAAQAAPPCALYTAASSDTWITALKHRPLQQQVLLVRQRFTCDARTRGMRPIGDRITPTHLHWDTDPRPEGVTLLYVVDGQVIAHDSTAQFLHLVTVQSVKTLDLVSGRTATALYGYQGVNGIAVVTTKIH
ncbi:hypothetical protein [Hymenobacter psoromatis]|uniref:hypothetical protein n=1 Tax=Hymenobacter psoromatis TaxID=1484116 RepID=UPI001CBFC9C4|nr:hypothetical protein [Hymenobacter psoromatis]